MVPFWGGGATHLRGSCGPSKKLKLKNYIFRHICDGLKTTIKWPKCVQKLLMSAILDTFRPFLGTLKAS